MSRVFLGGTCVRPLSQGTGTAAFDLSAASAFGIEGGLCARLRGVSVSAQKRMGVPPVGGPGRRGRGGQGPSPAPRVPSLSGCFGVRHGAVWNLKAYMQ